MRKKAFFIVIIFIFSICGCIQTNNDSNNDFEKLEKNKVEIPPDIDILHPKIPIYVGSYAGFTLYDDLNEITFQITNSTGQTPEKRYYHYLIYNKTGLAIYHEDWIADELVLPINFTVSLPKNPPYFIWCEGNPVIDFYIWGNIKNNSLVLRLRLF